MSEQDVTQIGQGVVDAFNANDWDRFRALPTKWRTSRGVFSFYEIIMISLK